MTISDSLSSVLEQLMPGHWRVVETRAVGGGCISEAQCVRVQDHNGRRTLLFVKRNDVSFLDNFQCEWDGLMRLSETGAVGVPQPLAVGVSGGSAWLITEWIDHGPQTGDFFSRFGRDLAELHRKTLGDRIGLPLDNYLGAARQINSHADTWPQFFAECRIGYQIRWARDQGLADHQLTADGERIAGEMDRLLEGREEATSLLHGDLWSGNYLCDASGRPMIIDPAVYYGCREAEFGMLRLFGSCGDDFYRAYHDSFPMPDGWQRRVSVYVLYHLLNHLNLFGRGYLGQCRSTAAEILQSV